jgi:hypothetical protein
MKTAAWRAGYRATNGFGQFYRDWQPSEEHYPPIRALHGSLTQSGMWVAMAERAASIRMLCPDQRGAKGPTNWQRCRHSRPRGTTSPIRPDIIFGKDRMRVGKKIKLLPRQIAFIRKVYDVRTRIGIDSAPRRNGKTGLVAACALARILRF